MMMIDGDNDETRDTMMLKREPAMLSTEEGGALEPKRPLQAVTMRSFKAGKIHYGLTFESNDGDVVTNDHAKCCR